MENKWYFKDEMQKRFVEGLIKDAEKTEQEIKEYSEKITKITDETSIELYSNLLKDSEDRLESYKKIIELQTGPEFVYSEAELAAMGITEAPQPQTEDAYWDYLLEQAKNNPDEPELEDFVEDIIAIKESTDDAVYFAERADAELTEAENILNDAIEEAEEFLEKDLATESFLNSIEDKLKSSVNNGSISEEQSNIANEILTDIANWRNSNSIENMKQVDDKLMKTLSEEAVAKHPIRYMIGEMKETLSDIRDAKLHYKEAHGGMLSNLKDSAKVLALRTQSHLLPIKTAVMDAARSSVEMAAGVLNFAATKFTEIADKGKEFILKGTHKLAKFEAKVLDMITLGAFSKIAKHCEIKRRDKAETFDKDTANRFEKAANCINKINITISDKLRGEEPEKFWDEVQKEAFLWGNLKDDNGQVIDYMRSPIQATQDGITKAMTAVKNATDKTTTFFKDTKSSIQADILGFKAEMAERRAVSYDKKERRTQAKITQFSETDKKLFEINTELKKTLHKLNSITPFEKQTYEPNQTITQSIEILKSMSGEKHIDFAIKMLEKDLKKEERRFNKKQDKLESRHERKYNKDTLSKRILTSITEHRLERNDEKMIRNLEKMENAKDKLVAIQERSEKFHNKSMENLNKATEKLNDMSQTKEEFSIDLN